MKDHRFFFITTYDKLTGSIINELLSHISEIQCCHTPDSKIIDDKNPNDNLVLSGLVDKFIQGHTEDGDKFYGNIQKFTAFELQNRILSEKTKTPFFSVSIIARPELRVRLLIDEWKKHPQLKTNPEMSLIQLFYKNSINDKSYYNLHHIGYYLELVTNTFLEVTGEKPKKNDTFFTHALALVLACDTADLPISNSPFDIEKLLSEYEQIELLYKRITGETLHIDNQSKNNILESQQKYINHLKKISDIDLPHSYTAIIAALTEKKLKTIYYPHLNNALNYYYTNNGIERPSKKQTDPIKKLLSIQLNSNRPAQLVRYFDNIDETCHDTSLIEVIVNIDNTDSNMRETLKNEIEKRNFDIKFIETDRPKSFCDLWKPINELLDLVNPDAYFMLNISDEMLFANQGWDQVLKNYVGFFEDGIFRLRASRNKFRNYFDRWECSFAQDSIPITTQKWVRLGGNWNPCFGPDSFQQLVSFYLFSYGKFSNEQYVRDIPILDINFFGDIPSLGISEEKKWKHLRDHIKAMQICQSYQMQTEAKRRAMILLANITANNYQLTEFEARIDKRKKLINLFDYSTNTTLAQFSYKLNWLGIFLENQYRKLRYFDHFGDGLHTKKSIGYKYLQYLKSVHYPAQFTYRIFRYINARKFIVRKLINNPILAFHKVIKLIKKNKINSLSYEIDQLRNMYTAIRVENEKLKNLILSYESKNGKNQ